MSHKSVDLQGVHVRPLPKEIVNSVLCTHCKQHAAKWEFAEGAQTAQVFSCSFCFLYELPALRDQRLQLDWLIEMVEKSIADLFPRDEESRLRVPEHADRIAFGIVMTQRFMQSRTLAGGFSS